jgi:predicted amidohydrolase
MNPAHQAKDVNNAGRLTVALGEYDTGWHDPAQSMARAREIAQQAESAGADLLVLPEMCATGFTMDADEFAEPTDGPSVQALSRLAAEFRLWIIAGLAMRRAGRYLNSALVYSPQGSVVATYDKQRLFGFAGETSIYSAGSGPSVVNIGGVSIGLFVCFDLRFPELFREVAPQVDACVVIANWPSVRQQHWEVLTQARAIENQFYLIGVNRVGEGDGLIYTGGSVILDPWGKRIDAEQGQSPLRIADICRRAVVEAREAFPLGLDAAARPD